MNKFASKIFIQKLFIIVFSILYLCACHDKSEIKSAIIQIENLEINSWDQFSQKQFNAVLKQIQKDGFSESNFETIALMCWSHGELQLSKTLFLLLSKKSILTEYDYYLAEMAIDEESYDEAHKYIIQGLSKANVSDKIELYLLRIDMLMSLGKFDKAQSTLDRVTQLQSHNIHANYLQAKLSLSTGKCKEAITAFQNLIDTLPQYTQFYSPLASAYRMCGQSELAQQYSQQNSSEILQFPNRFINKKESIGNPVASLKNDIKVSISQRHYQKAVQQLRQLIKIEPKDTKAYVNLGSMYFQLKNLPKAQESYLKAYTLNPQNVKVSVNLGIVNMALGDYKKAELHFKNALKISPYHLKATVNLAGIKLSENKPSEAERLLIKLLDKNHSNSRVQTGLIVSLCMQSKYDIALEKINTWIKFEPDSLALLQMYAKVLLQNLKASSKSVNNIQKKLSIHAKESTQLVEIYVLLRIKYENIQDFDEAVNISENLTNHKLSKRELQKLKLRFDQLKSVGYLGVELFNE